MILCITEKPSVGQTIAQILGANVRRNGYFEGNGYWVSWTFGHLCTLKDPSDYTDVWKRWALSSLPMIPPRFGIKLINDRGVEQQFKVLCQLIADCDEIINCGDAGQEGELIQRWVMQKAGCKKPVKRLWISSLTDEAIKTGFLNLRPEKDLEPLYLAGLCRAIGDWLLGINATRLYTLKYASERGHILSVGRVQTPTLAMIVNRQKEIENFVPKDSWELKTKYRDTVFTAQLKAFETEDKGKIAVEKIIGETFKVTDIQKKAGKEEPPRLMDLTSLQVECNKKYGYSADETLKLIQTLYERKVTTYPRVDTTYLPEDMYPKCGGILNGLKDYQQLLEPLRGKKLKKSKKTFDNSKITDHHAIIPTGVQFPADLGERERNVFDTVARHFIAAFYPECKFTQTTVKGKTGNVDFKTSGKVINDLGWKIIFNNKATADEKEKETEDDKKILPEFTLGESGPHSPFLAKKTTQPPKYYTEATLLRAMETAGSQVGDEALREALKANGIGRPSTRAAIIEILFKRGYIVRERKALKATQAGVDLINLIHEELLKSPKLTGIWEGRLREIERGQYAPQDFIDQLKQHIQSITTAVISDSSNRRIQTELSKPIKKSGSSKPKKGEK
ncbi:MAG: DNA topoisomerase 3 [Muribaculaceae bacterium]|nr:DNA topoisomerase 3 [Muribaculaceae bacterium]